MPLRHSADFLRYRRVLAAVDARTAVQEKAANLLVQFAADESCMPLDPLAATTRAFLARQAAYSSSHASPTPVFLSLSGGVNSMVLSKILAHLRDQGELHLSAVVAIHIDYGNRAESAAEAAFVAQWSQSLDIACSVRAIDEVKRGITAREDYERVAREIRYAAYREAIAAYAPPDTAPPDLGVIFGHHQVLLHRSSTC